ncbi:MAG: hypothetical protein R3E79_41410 [Caldilineaceae bacterium]
MGWILWRWWWNYPETVNDMTATLTCTVEPPVGQMTPYFVKVVQVDGAMAWASPIYVVRA